MSEHMRPERRTGFAEGNVRTILRLEGLLLLISAIYAYWIMGGSALTFALLFLVPDLAFLAFVFGPRYGSIAYNIGHTTILPLAGLVLVHALNLQSVTPFLLIWLAHIGFDRVVGYGLKYATSFDHTHLGLIGQSKRQNQ